MPLDFERIAAGVLEGLKAKKSLPDLAELEQLLGDEEPEAPIISVVEVDQVTFQDMLIARHGGQDVRQKPTGGDFAEFLENDAKERRAAAQAIRKRRGERHPEG